ncbi:MAG: hypothetical protein IPK50_09345 [Fibrobacterota bacterium]|nr:hypothetical protein [Fibrobacterota bacterium]QQS07082.1 MAG: hypothetical protein IPK50_09345 [Fibrobacterota bacterium]
MLSVSAQNSTSSIEDPSSDADSMLPPEVLGTVPIWVLAGFRLERIGWRRQDSGWSVGVYRLEEAEPDLENIELQ